MGTEIGFRFYNRNSFWKKLLYSVTISIIIVWCYSVRSQKYKILHDIPPNCLKYVYHKDISSKILNSSEARRLINEHNKAETILHSEDFGPLENNTVIIVISVTQLHQPLKYLIASLCSINGIQDTLIVFSHLIFDETLNNFIQSMDCCRVLQIFYPYSLQVFKDEFPGPDKYYCPSNMKIAEAKTLKCTPADVYGKFRNPSQAQKKHFWWWTANRIFEHVLSANGNNGLVVFLEDDVFVLSDFLYMLIYMHKLGKSMNQCEFIYLGLHEWSLENKTYNIDLTTWYPKEHSSVLAFDVSVWNTIVEHYDLFCNFGDSWSQSLFYISLNRRENSRFKVAYSTIPRAIKITTCFFNGFYDNCNVLDNVIRALRMQRYLGINLFPPYLEVFMHIELEDDELTDFDMLDGQGDWNDPRDKALCMLNITENKVNIIPLGVALDLPDTS